METVDVNFADPAVIEDPFRRFKGTVYVSQHQELPLLKSARREAIVAFAIWAAATCYSLTYCVTHGYGRDPETLTYVLGFPDWVFWGIVVPWGVCTIVATLFAFFFMKDEELPESGNA